MNEFMNENEKEWKMTGITNKVCKNDRQSERVSERKVLKNAKMN